MEEELDRMAAIGLIHSELRYYSAHYRINRDKLIRVFRLARALPESAQVNVL